MLPTTGGEGFGLGLSELLGSECYMAVAPRFLVDGYSGICGGVKFWVCKSVAPKFTLIDST